jgi:V8-like Glu-specific endopeptidase
MINLIFVFLIHNLFSLSGGKIDTSESYPFVMFFEIQGSENGCTGTLIDPYTILTAAHCFDNHQRTVRINIRNGGTKRAITVPITNLQIDERHVPGPERTGSEVQNDLAYFRVERNLAEYFDIDISMIPKMITSKQMAENLLTENNFTGTIVGYGGRAKQRSFGSVVGVNAKTKAGVNIISSHDSAVTRVTTQSDKVKTVKGDSGGGLYLKDKDNKYYIFGVLSGFYITENKQRVGFYATLEPKACWVGVSMDNYSTDCNTNSVTSSNSVGSPPGAR